eukprot:s6529_g5.t1
MRALAALRGEALAPGNSHGGAWSRPFGDSVALAAGTLAQPTMGPDDDFEDQAGGVRLASALRALQTQGLFCDIAISAGNEQYLAHQAVLASRSKMLHDHILSQSKDQGSPAPELSLPPQPLEIRLSADMAAQEACYEACTECSLAFLRVFLLTLHLKIPGPQGSRSPGPSQKLRAMLALFLRH